MYISYNPYNSFLNLVNDELNQRYVKYAKYYITIEEYCSRNKLMIGGYAGLSSFVDYNIYAQIDKFDYVLYANDPYKHAYELINLLYSKTKKDLLVLKTILTNMEYTISLGFITLTKIKKDQNIELNKSLVDIFKSPKRKVYFSDHQAYLIDPWFFLIPIYEDICNPSKCDFLDKLIFYETKIAEYINIYYNAKPRMQDKYKYQINAQVKNALKEITHKKTIKVEYTKIKTIIIDYSIKDFYEILAKHLPDAKLMLMIHKLQCFEDIRMKKSTIYIVQGDNKIPIINVYNIGKYMLIPHRNYTASIFISLMILMVEMWYNIIVLGRTGEENPLKNRNIKDYLIRYNYLYFEKRKNKDIAEEIYNGEWFGNYQNIMNYKIFASKKNMISYPYYPAIQQSTT